MKFTWAVHGKNYSWQHLLFHLFAACYRSRRILVPAPCSPSASALCCIFRPKVEMQEEQIRQLEHHAAQLKQSLKAGGIVNPSVTSTDVDDNAEGEQPERSESRGADGELP